MLSFRLNNGINMDCIGYGTYKISGDTDARKCVVDALEVGYRRIDTAVFYNNEDRIGLGIQDFGIDRKDLFITTKVWTNVIDRQTLFKTVDDSLNRLRTDYIDLLLIHWPTKSNIEVWNAMEELYNKGTLKAIGVSNFKEHHIEELLDNCRVRPMVNQVELHPEFQQVNLRKYCIEHGIRIEAWSPLLRGKVNDNEILKDIAAKYGRSIPQIVLRFDIQQNIMVIPKSTHIERMKENYDIFDFELSNDDVERIAAIDKGLRMFRDPDNHGF